MRPTKEALIVRRALDLRITRWQSKLAYIATFIVARYAVLELLTVCRVHPLAINITDSLVLLAGIMFGARIFRGKGEQIAPARPWWQMTAWPKLSRRLGVRQASRAAVGRPFICPLSLVHCLDADGS